MTEAEWLVSDEPERMLRWLRTADMPDSANLPLQPCPVRASERKMRLLALAFHDASGCNVLNRDLFVDEDGPLPTCEAMDHLAACCYEPDRKKVTALKAAILRDIAGNPFRPVETGPRCANCGCQDCTHKTGDCRCRECGGSDWTDLERWLRCSSGTVPKLAQVIYDERRFVDLPILADALEEAGCDDADILAHCRGPGQHVCGCWVVDLLLEKE